MEHVSRWEQLVAYGVLTAMYAAWFLWLEGGVPAAFAGAVFGVLVVLNLCLALVEGVRARRGRG